MPERQHPAEWVVELLRNDHNRADFSCGDASLDGYLKQQAGQDLRRACATPFVLVPERGGTLILGYYTLSSYGIDIGELPADLAKKLPRYPVIPATLLGRLAVDHRYQGQGIGRALMHHLVAIAHDAGFKELIAEVLPDNTPMLKVFEKSGLRVDTTRERGVVHALLHLC